MYNVHGNGLGADPEEIWMGDESCTDPRDLGLDPDPWVAYPGLCLEEGYSFYEYVSKMRYTQVLYAAIAADILEARLKAAIKKGAPYATNFATEELKGARQDAEGFWHAVITYIGKAKTLKLKDPSENYVVNKLDKSKYYQRWAAELTEEDLRVGRGASGARVDEALRVTRTPDGRIAAPERPTPDVPTAAEVGEGVVPPSDAPPAAAAAAAAPSSGKGWWRRHWGKVVSIGVAGAAAVALMGVVIAGKEEA